MAIAATLRIKSFDGGEIKGSYKGPGAKHGSIAVMGFDHTIENARDKDNKWKLTHNAIKIQKDVDVSSPALRQAMVNANHKESNISECTITFHRMEGGLQVLMRVTLEEANIDAIRMYMQDIRTPEGGLMPEQEEVTLTYKGIAWVAYEPADAQKDASSASTFSLPGVPEVEPFELKPKTFREKMMERIKETAKELLKHAEEAGKEYIKKQVESHKEAMEESAKKVLEVLSDKLKEKYGYLKGDKGKEGEK
jgi:type VI secretion system Hcp family effector